MRPKLFPISVTTVGGAYSAGNVVGGLLTLPVGQGTGQWALKNLYVVDLANQGAELMVHFFKSKPVGTYTDQAALSWGAGDTSLLVASVEVLAATYKTQNAVAIAETAYSVNGYTVMPSTAPIDNSAATPWYPLAYVVMTTTGTPTYGAGAKILLNVGLLVDER